MGCAVPTIITTGPRESWGHRQQPHFFAMVITFAVFSVRDELRLKKKLRINREKQLKVEH
jgi:hypothetical protein